VNEYILLDYAKEFNNRNIHTRI